MIPRGVILRHLPLAGKRNLAALVTVNVLLGVLPVAFVVATAALVEAIPGAVRAGTGSGAWDTLVTAFLAAAACFAGQQVLTPAQTALGELVRRRVDGVVHDRLIEISLRSDGIGPLEDPAALDALTEASHRLETARDTPGMACAGMLALVARYLRLTGFCVLVGVLTDVPAALALAGAVAAFRYGHRGGMRRYGRVWRTIMPFMRRGEYLRGVAIDSPAAKELRVFGLTEWIGDRYAENYRHWTGRVAAERRRVFLTPFLGYTLLGVVVTAAVLLDLVHRAAGGEVGAGGLVLGLQATLAAVMLGENYAEADLPTTFGIRAAQALERFESLVEATDPPPEDGPATPGGTPPSPGGAPRGEIRFDRLTFTYPGSSRPVFEDLTLDLPAGRCTALVGVNGTGKTTLVKLLTRLYEPASGAIRLDGTDLRDLDLAQWRRTVSVIFQDFVRYELSAADNIALGAPHVPRDDDAIRRAAALAGIDDVLEGLPAGYDTPLARTYRGGADLSGGQWQRVAIARSLYAVRAGARVLVLDEPTSALDVRAEAAFFDRFVELTAGVTTLLISHRFSSVRRADRIVVLDGGRVAETGSHDALMAADGHYARLFRLQAERFAAGLDAEGEILDPLTEVTA